MRSSRRLFILQAALATVLLFAVAALGVRVIVRALPGGPPQLRDATHRYLRAATGRITFTYYVSAADALPAGMKELEPAVRRLFAAFQRAAPDRIDYRVIDPDLDPEHGTVDASRRAASSFKVRKVLKDESSETSVWSSIVIAHERFENGLIQGIMPADLPHLEDLIVETLKSAERPTAPVIAVLGPRRGYEQLRSSFSSLVQARVVDADRDPTPRVPPEADLLVWIDPRDPTREDAEAIDRFLASGRSVIVAGSLYSVDSRSEPAGKQLYRIRRAGGDWNGFLHRFGLSFEPRVLLDKERAQITWQKDGVPVTVDAPFQFRVPPACVDTRSLLGPSVGMLLVGAVSALKWSPAVVDGAGWRAEVLATTTDQARAMDFPEGDFDDSAFDGATPVPKQPWMVVLKPKDAWKGDLIVAGSPVLFHDAAYAQGTNANQAFLRTLLRTYTSPQRLARSRAFREEPERVGTLSSSARAFWRAFTVLMLPIAYLVLAVRRGRTRALGTRMVPWIRPAVVGAVAYTALVATLVLAGTIPLDLDLTETGVNTPSPSTARRFGGEGQPTKAELVMSESFRMPSEFKRIETRVLARLRTLGIRPALVRPEDLTPEERQMLGRGGIAPFDVDVVENDTPASVRVWSALRLSRSGREELVPRIDGRTVEHLDFLLASAAERLETGRTPVVGILSDLPRLSPAEAHEYQEQSYVAPVGSDVYSIAKELLAAYGYRVVYINPEAPVFPDGMDLLVWLQPRFPQRCFPQFADFMARGGRAIVALQHYNVQQRQYRGGKFTTVYWPQPQFHHFNEYLSLIGVRQIGEKYADEQGEHPGEVLFDRQHADLVLQTQVNRTAFREHDPQQVSKPFLIRAAGAGLSPDSVITSKLGGLLFIWGSRFALAEDNLASLGITATTLVSTSPMAWNYAWSGGWIPDQSFAEPATFLPGPQPLAVLLEGTFPEIALMKDAQGRESIALSRPATLPTSAPRLRLTAPPGKLLLIGSSEMFKDSRIQDPGYQHDQFLLNAAAFLTYGPELAEVQARVQVPRVIPYQSSDKKILWRGLVVGAPPISFLAFGVVWWLVRRRPVVRGVV